MILIDRLKATGTRRGEAGGGRKEIKYITRWCVWVGLARVIGGSSWAECSAEDKMTDKELKHNPSIDARRGK